MSTLPLKDISIRVRESNGKIYFKVSDLEKFPEWPDGPLVEILMGELFLVPSPTTEHQRISSNLQYKIKDYLTKKNLGEIFTAPIDVELSDEDLTIPDLVFISNNNSDIIKEKQITGSPNLIIEIVSSNKKQDYVDKKIVYEKFKVKEYWIIDYEENLVLVYLLKGEKYDKPIEFQLSDTIKVNEIPGLQLKIR